MSLVPARLSLNGLAVHPALDVSQVTDLVGEGKTTWCWRPVEILVRDGGDYALGASVHAREVRQELVRARHSSLAVGLPECAPAAALPRSRTSRRSRRMGRR